MLHCTTPCSNPRAFSFLAGTLITTHILTTQVVLSHHQASRNVPDPETSSNLVSHHANLPSERRALGLPLCSMFNTCSSWSAIHLASPVSFTSHRSCLSKAPLWPSGAARGQGYRYELCQFGRSHPAPLQALPLGLIRSNLALPGGQAGRRRTLVGSHTTAHDGGNALPCVSYVSVSVSALPVGCTFSLTQSCPAFWACCSMWLTVSRPCSGRVPPPRFSSHLDVLLRGGNSRGRLCPQSNPKNSLHHLAHECFTYLAQWHISLHPVAPVTPGLNILGSPVPGQPVSRASALGQLGSGRESCRVESPQLVFSAFTDYC